MPPPTSNSCFPVSPSTPQVGQQLYQVQTEVAQLKAEGAVGDRLILELGTNGPYSVAQMEDLLNSFGPMRKIVLVNTRVPRPWQQQVNETIAAVAQSYPNATVVNWYARQRRLPAVLLSRRRPPRPGRGQVLRLAPGPGAQGSAASRTAQPSTRCPTASGVGGQRPPTPRSDRRVQTSGQGYGGPVAERLGEDARVRPGGGRGAGGPPARAPRAGRPRRRAGRRPARPGRRAGRREPAPRRSPRSPCAAWAAGGSRARGRSPTAGRRTPCSTWPLLRSALLATMSKAHMACRTGLVATLVEQGEVVLVVVGLDEELERALAEAGRPRGARWGGRGPSPAPRRGRRPPPRGGRDRRGSPTATARPRPACTRPRAGRPRRRPG